jgi:hypothetical protein
MTLVPIIYTSLLIFTALLAFVLFVSYISYKAKSRGKQPPYYQNLVKPAFVPQYRSNEIKLKVVKPLPVQIASPTFSNSNQTQKHIQRQMEKKYANSLNGNSNYVKKYKVENLNEAKTEGHYSRNSSKVSNHYNTRIEIMNDTEKFRTQQNGYRHNLSEQINNNRGLSEMNLLNYYSDSPDSNFMRLTAANVSQAV